MKIQGLSRKIKECNVGKVYLAVSHITVQNHKINDHVFKYFDKVFTTNSKFDNYFVPFKKANGGVQPKNLTIIKQW